MITEDVLYCTSLLDFSVEITDTTYPITVSGTYFTDNNLSVLSTLDVITDGYRMTYSTLPSGNMTLVAHASNSNNEYLTKTYELQYGYEAVWQEVKCWSPSKEVPISVTASNSVLAPNTAYFSTFFTTKRYESTDLEIMITAEGSGHLDFTGLIKPQSTYFLQGRTYSITVSGIKDFSSNILEPKTFTFTIKDY